MCVLKVIELEGEVFAVAERIESAAAGEALESMEAVMGVLMGFRIVWILSLIVSLSLFGVSEYVFSGRNVKELLLGLLLFFLVLEVI